MELCANLSKISDKLLYLLNPFLPVICATDNFLGKPQSNPPIRGNGPVIVQPFCDNIVTRPFMWRNIRPPGSVFVDGIFSKGFWQQRTRFVWQYRNPMLFIPGIWIAWTSVDFWDEGKGSSQIKSEEFGMGNLPSPSITSTERLEPVELIESPPMSRKGYAQQSYFHLANLPSFSFSGKFSSSLPFSSWSTISFSFPFPLSSVVFVSISVNLLPWS